MVRLTGKGEVHGHVGCGIESVVLDRALCRGVCGGWRRGEVGLMHRALSGGREDEEEEMGGWSEGIDVAGVWSTGTWVKIDEEPMFHFIMRLFFVRED